MRIMRFNRKLPRTLGVWRKNKSNREPLKNTPWNDQECVIRRDSPPSVLHRVTMASYIYAMRMPPEPNSYPQHREIGDPRIKSVSALLCIAMNVM